MFTIIVYNIILQSNSLFILINWTNFLDEIDH